MEIPSWLYFALSPAGSKKDKWNEEKQKLAERIITNLKKHAETEYWQESTLKEVLYFNEHDDIRGYMQDVKNKED